MVVGAWPPGEPAGGMEGEGGRQRGSQDGGEREREGVREGGMEGVREGGREKEGRWEEENGKKERQK